jgi:autotransporter-associated beta strand protein
MKKIPSALLVAACSAALACVPLSSQAGTLVYDSGASAGIQAGNETWDFNATSNWTTDGGTSRVNWTNNSDLAVFSLQGSPGTVTISNSGGQVATGGLTFSGTTGGTSNTWTLGADTSTGIQLGAGGLTNQISDGFLIVNAPLALAASQTWSSTKLGTNTSTAGVRINGAISALSGTTNLTFDGMGLSSAVKTANGDSRVIIELGGDNSFTGTTTVTGGAVLRLNYTTNGGSKLDDSSALILKGGSIVLNGGSGVTEVVGSTTIDSGANTIYVGSGGGGGTTNKIALGELTHNVSGTLDLTSAVSGVATTTTGTTNGIIGGWATLGGNRFAAVSSGTIVNTSGSTRNDYSAWTATTNGIINGVVTNASGDKSLYTLRVSTGGSLTLASGTATIAGGGIIGDGGGPISGGNLTSGTDALYVHTPSALTISSAIVDGVSAIALVKAGSNTLTINGTNTYTGATYVNSGILAMTGGSLANGNVFVRGAATFTMNTSSAISFNINGTSTGQFDVFTQDAGGFFTLGGTMDLKFGSTFAGGASFDLYDLSSGTADGFTTISISGSYIGSLDEITPGLWTGTVGGQSFTFNESSGILNIAAASIPEPASAAALFGVGALALFTLRRRRC